MKILPVANRPLAAALGLGPALLARAEAEGVPWLAASVVEGPAVALGAAQRAGRVLDLTACATAGIPVLRRATTGPSVYAGARALVWTLALPHIAALVPDATPRTLLNRNVRGFLAGFSRAGGIAHYFGREWISVKKQPAAVMGFETTPGGAVLIEVIAGWDASPALPRGIATEAERAVDRWLGKEPAALGALLGGEPEAVAREVARTVALRAAARVDEVGEVEVTPAASVAKADDPMGEGFAVGPMWRVPIGWIESGVDRARGEVWLGGDVIAPRWALSALARGEALPGEVAVDGASVGDLVGLVRAARSEPG